jgi:hypothetical protein
MTLSSAPASSFCALYFSLELSFGFYGQALAQIDKFSSWSISSAPRIRINEGTKPILRTGSKQ